MTIEELLFLLGLLGNIFLAGYMLLRVMQGTDQFTPKEKETASNLHLPFALSCLSPICWLFSLIGFMANPQASIYIVLFVLNSATMVMVGLLFLILWIFQLGIFAQKNIQAYKPSRTP